MSGLSHKQKGATLLEILITILVISFGLLGLAGLQAVSLKNNNTAYYRSQASMMSHDIIERMRVNKAAALAGAYSVTKPTAGTIAGDDLIEWRGNIANVIPMRDGHPEDISVVVGLNGDVTIAIQWDGNGDGVINPGNGSDTRFVVQSRLGS